MSLLVLADSRRLVAVEGHGLFRASVRGVVLDWFVGYGCFVWSVVMRVKTVGVHGAILKMHASSPLCAACFMRRTSAWPVSGSACVSDVFAVQFT